MTAPIFTAKNRVSFLAMKQQNFAEVVRNEVFTLMLKHDRRVVLFTAGEITRDETLPTIAQARKEFDTISRVLDLH